MDNRSSPYDSSSPYNNPPSHDSSVYGDGATLPDGWPRVSRGHMIAFGIGVAVLWLLILTSRQQFVIPLDYANLAIHETGHLVFMPFGDTLQMWGGTLFQCIVPIVFGVYFWRKRQTAGLAVAGVWLGENFLNIARYAADAKVRVLPLVGGGRHDWQFIFNKLGCINSCTTIVAGIKIAGWIIMLAAVAWYIWRWRVSEEHAAQRREQAQREQWNTRQS